MTTALPVRYVGTCPEANDRQLRRQIRRTARAVRRKVKRGLYFGAETERHDLFALVREAQRRGLELPR